MTDGYQANILKMYEKIQNEEEKNLKKRREEIKKNCPEIINIERQIAKCCMDVSLNAIKNTKNQEQILSNLKDKITELRVKKSEMLVSNGYDINYLDKHYRCNKCKDTGFIGNQKCSCYKQKLINLYYKNSDLDEMVKYNNFNNFKIEYFSTEIERGEDESPRNKIKTLLLKSKNFINNFDSSKENLLFYGNPGTGKTFLSHCIAKELLDRGYLVVYRTAEDLIQNLRNVRFNNDTTTENLIINCDLLIIDDLGTEQLNDFSKTELFNLLNKKLLKNKKMIISTNYSLEDLLRYYTDRFTSRLLGNFTLCKFVGDDIRIKINLSRTKNN